MQISQYHKEWVKYVDSRGERNLIEFLQNEVVMPILKQNKYYSKYKGKTDNSGIIKLISEFEGYIQASIRPSEQKGILYCEGAYVLWLLGIRLKDHYGAALQKRINEWFKGSTYYESGYAGYRQFEYEAHIIARLVEEGIDFVDEEREHHPDVVVIPNSYPFYLEIKLPTSSVKTCLEKAFSQIHPHENKGAVVIGLDYILANTEAKDQESRINTCLNEATQLISGKDSVVFLEWIALNDSEPGSRVYRIIDDKLYDKKMYEVLSKALVG